MYHGPAWFWGRTANGRTAHVCSRGYKCRFWMPDNDIRYNCGSKIVRSFFVTYSPLNGFKYTTFSRITSIINELLLFLIPPFWLYYVGKGIWNLWKLSQHKFQWLHRMCPICVNVSLLRKRTTPSFCCIRYQEYFVSQ